MHYKLSVQNSNSSPLDLSTPVFSPPTQTYFPIIPKYISRLLPFFQWVRRDCWLANLFCSAHWCLFQSAKLVFTYKKDVAFKSAPRPRISIKGWVESICIMAAIKLC